MTLFSIAGLLHGLGAMALLVLGSFIALRPKQRSSRHPQLGRIYAAIMPPALILGVVVGLRHAPSVSVFQIIVGPTLGLLGMGFWAATPRGRRVLGARWVTIHARGMGGSLIALFTGLGFQIAGYAGMAIGPISGTLLGVGPTIPGYLLTSWALDRRRRAAVLPAVDTPVEVG